MQDSVDSTYFADGDAAQLKNSIQQHIGKLDGSTPVSTGHGPETTFWQ